MKVIIAIIVIIILIVVGYYVFYPQNQESATEKLNRAITKEEQLIMNSNIYNINTLKDFDGKNSQKAYIAVNGVVYDVSDKWKNGEHHGLKAGQDLTQEFLDSSHGSNILSKLSIVGRYQE